MEAASQTATTTTAGFSSLEAWTRPLPVGSAPQWLSHGEVQETINALPGLVHEVSRFFGTAKGDQFAMLRNPAFVLATNKLEGSLPTGISQEQSFLLLRNHFLSKDFFVEHDWHLEGEDTSPEAAAAQHIACASAVAYMMDTAKDGGALATEHVLQFHKLLTTNARDKGKAFVSRLRSPEEHVHAGQFQFPTPVNMRSALDERLSQAEKLFATAHPLAYACALLLEVLTLHPFLDGNGRVARICFAYGLARWGIPFPVIFTNGTRSARKHYGLALIKAQGQKGPPSSEWLHSIAATALYAALYNMKHFCTLE